MAAMTTVDPIFAAIERHRLAEAAYVALVKVRRPKKPSKR